MSNVQFNPISSVVHTTTNYSLFKSIDGNRTKNNAHVKRLKKSMQEKYLFTVITVNEKYEIIDGQHRFDCIQELGLPLNYIICSDYGLDEVHRLNAISKNWNSDDYMHGYADLGLSEYVEYRKFKNKYKFGHHETLIVLSGVADVPTRASFYEGTFKIKNLKDAYHFAECVLKIKPLYSGYNRRYFLYALISLFKKQNFDFDTFLHKLSLQPTALVDCAKTTQYLDLIEQIYNYRNRNKVNLRF
jgi:hypothetical protein